MHLHDNENSKRSFCYAMMGLVALLAFGVFAALPLIKGDDAWLSVPVLLAAAFAIGYIQDHCGTMQK